MDVDFADAGYLEDFHIVGGCDRSRFAKELLARDVSTIEKWTAEEKSIVVDVYAQRVWFSCFVFALCHCSNIKLAVVDPERKASALARKKYGRPLTRYRILTIASPARKMHGGEYGTERLTAEHLQRGHFKTFTADKPLFGSRVGTYWWNPQMRGNNAAGEVVKDYAIARDGAEVAR